MSAPQNPRVKQADRDAAKSLLGRDDAGPSWWSIDSGNADNDPMVQAFARHREEAEAASKAREAALAGAVIDAVLALEDAANWMQDYVNGLPVSAPPIEHYRLVANTSRAALTKEPDA